MGLSRRHFLAVAPGSCALTSALGAAATGCPDARNEEPAPQAVWPGFPQQRRDLVREMVGVCHRDVDRVRALLDEHPALVNATWDWGFGDFETALGAAAHTGRRNIAELLLERGARLDLFAAAMLGKTEAVKAMIETVPGIQRSPGPHGITLLAHAQAGGEPARETLAYLESLGDADNKPRTEPLTDEQKRRYVGRFRSPALGDGSIEIGVNKNGDMMLKVDGEQAALLRYAGDYTFFPAGAPSVRITVDGAGADMHSLAMVDHVLILTAARIGEQESVREQPAASMP